MTAERPPDPQGAAPGEEPGDEEHPQSVFGNLPRTRPGARSPRRDAAGAAGAGGRRATREPPAPAKAAAPIPEDDAARALADSEPPRDDAPDETDPDGGGIEDIAWAGVAAAAEAATIGVRLATRALEAMRDAVDRR